MRLTACEMPIYRPGRGTNQALIEEFSESGNQCMMIEGWDESHQSMKSAQSAMIQAAKRLGKMHIKCVSSGGNLFLINTLAFPH